ncbi:MAG: alanine/ornithine racemase family PLP-dependent enzyme [Bacillota bacterium]
METKLGRPVPPFKTKDGGLKTMYPRIVINLCKIRENAALLLDYCSGAGIRPCAVTKAVCGDLAVARALVEAGFSQLADSRLENIHRLRQAVGVQVETLLLRIPMLSQCDRVVRECDCSLNSEPVVLEALNAAAARLGKTHRVILMVDLGDLREGIWPERLAEVRRLVQQCRHLRVAGLGTNLTCYGGVVPTPEKLSQLTALQKEWEKEGEPLEILSGGNSSSLGMVLERSIPEGINHLRLGESILLGRETVYGQPIPGAHLDAFVLQAEVVELKEKPSIPSGQISRDAFGRKPVFKDRGVHRRAILAIGRQDTDFSMLPLQPELEIIGGSSDHLLLDAEKLPDLKVGDAVSFIPGYGALLAAMTSPYVEKIYQNSF